MDCFSLFFDISALDQDQSFMDHPRGTSELSMLLSRKILLFRRILKLSFELTCYLHCHCLIILFYLQTSADVRGILLELFACTNGSEWNRTSDWGSFASLNDWEGVKFTDADGLLELELVGNNLFGELMGVIVTFNLQWSIDF